jgi:dipeptidyl aminopeptidase/acylaminoacyl peptidase
MAKKFFYVCAGLFLVGLMVRFAVGPAIAQAGFLRVSDGSHYDSSPTWSPDGARIAFVRQTGSGFDLRTAPATGGPSTLVATFPPNWNFAGGQMEWSPQGDRIALYTGPPGDEAIYVVSIFEQPTPTTSATWGKVKDRYRK